MWPWKSQADVEVAALRERVKALEDEHQRLHTRLDTFRGQLHEAHRWMASAREAGVVQQGQLVNLLERLIHARAGQPDDKPPHASEETTLRQAAPPPAAMRPTPGAPQ
ncbi:MAG: hypothetical protein Q8J78_04930 [Moraxellaceae bacterium]|nr:hypothetical protein [Moraxellaceae bacterium]